MRALLTVAAILGLATVRARAASPVEGVWHLTGRVTATACAGRCLTQREPVDEQIVVTASGLSGVEGIAPACDGEVSGSDVDGLTTLGPARRRGWLRIRIPDRARFVRLMRQCVGYPSLRLRRVSGRVRIAPDGRAFDEVVFVSGSVSVYARRATFSAKGRVHAEWSGAGTAWVDRYGPAALARVVGAALGAD